jgi:hypothetical protein
MSMSLDGFVTGPNVRPDNGLGDGGHRLHEWALAGPDADADADHKAVSGRLTGINGKIFDEMMATGAAGMATTMTASRSSSSPAVSPASISHSGPW